MKYKEIIISARNKYSFEGWLDRADESYEKYIQENPNPPEVYLIDLSPSQWLQKLENYHAKEVRDNYEIPKEIFDELVLELVSLGEHADIDNKEECFQKAIEALDEADTNRDTRTLLHDLIDEIAKAAGLKIKVSEWSVCSGHRGT